MNSKIINVVLVCLLFLCVAGKANAGLIIGELYEDADESGLYWEYIGNFDLASGSAFRTATPYNGLEAAVLNFGGDISQFAIAAYDNDFSFDSVIIGDAIVNHSAWYDGNVRSISILKEDITADVNANGTYDTLSDLSAWVRDRAVLGDHINYVFKAVSVPEPSTLAIFMIALVGLTTRHFNKK